MFVKFSSFFNFFLNIEKDCIIVRWFHDVCNFFTQLIDQISCRMIDDLIKTFQTYSAFANISIEKSDSNNDVWKFT